MNSIKNIKNDKGFSLIEMAIVLIILGAVLAPLFTFLTQQQANDTQREEQVKNERALAALALYARQFGVFPCPADPTLGPGDADFGAAGTCSGTVSQGGLPFQDLNLPYRSSVNSDNWKYIYAVTSDLTTSATYGAGTGAITIDGFSTPLTNRQFVLVNPGRDGKGAFTLGGAAGDACGSTALDSENCDGDDTFIEADFSNQGSPTSSDYYDDTISYSLTRKESTFWVAEEGGASVDGISIVNRNQGNVGIGLAAGASPTDKLHIVGGDVRVQSDGTSGGNVNAQTVTADTVIRSEGSIEAEDTITAPVFYYDAP